MSPLVKVPLQKAHFLTAMYIQMSVKEEEEYILSHIWFPHDVPHYDNCIIAWVIRLGLLTMTLFFMACLVSIPLLYSVLKQWE